MKQYYVYILTNHSRTLYVGVTNNLKKRVWEHKNKLLEGFTKKYNIDQLIYYEQTDNVYSAIVREKQLKRWGREKKINLVEKMNPLWIDLADGIQSNRFLHSSRPLSPLNIAPIELNRIKQLFPPLLFRKHRGRGSVGMTIEK